jgi:hypothetical protein
VSEGIRFILKHPGSGKLTHILPGETYVLTIDTIAIWNDGDVRVYASLVDPERPEEPGWPDPPRAPQE